MKRKLAAVAAALAALALAFWLARPRPGPPPNVLLVTIDTLRFDRVGAYGYAAAETPVMDALARRGVRFTTAIAHAPLTAPSHASILTGLLPLGHGVRDNGAFVLPRQPTTLAEAFRGAGYSTAAFVSGFPLDHRYGFARGFDTYDDHLQRGGDARRAAYVERSAADASRAALAWMKGARRPWFAWVHYFDPHAPYEPPADLQARFAASPYDGEIASVDRELGALLKAVDTDASPALVLVTSDHGESLGEHGEATHGVFVYDATLRVPWIMAGPGVPQGRVSDVVARGIDVLPTLVDYAGLTVPAGVLGRSLRPAANGAGDGRRPRVRRVALLQPQPRLGRAARHEERALQADRGAAAGALRRRRRPRRSGGTSSTRTPARRRRCGASCGGRSRRCRPTRHRSSMPRHASGCARSGTSRGARRAGRRRAIRRTASCSSNGSSAAWRKPA